MIIQDHEANPDLTAKEVESELRETKEWKMIPPKSIPENRPGIDAIQKLIKEARDRKIRIGPDTRDRPWSLVSLCEYPVSSGALPFILKVWARSVAKNDPLTINQAFWISRIYVLFKAKILGDTSKSGKAKQPLSLKEYQHQRHTHASIMLKQGIHRKVVQERPGHATISTTLDLYSHVAPGLQEAAARHFDEAFSPKYNEMAEKARRKNKVDEKVY